MIINLFTAVTFTFIFSNIKLLFLAPIYNSVCLGILCFEFSKTSACFFIFYSEINNQSSLQTDSVVTYTTLYIMLFFVQYFRHITSYTQKASRIQMSARVDLLEGKSGLCLGLKNWSLLCADCLEILGASTFWTLKACRAYNCIPQLYSESSFL